VDDFALYAVAAEDVRGLRDALEAVKEARQIPHVL